jgi:hypothetical protein
MILTIRAYVEQFTQNIIINACCIAQALPVLSEQPEQIKGVKLHNYQLNAINWMLETEKNEKSE